MNNLTTQPDESANQLTFSVSVFASPTTLSKSFTLDAEGKINRVPGGHLSTGQVMTKTLGSMADFMALLEELTPNNALAYGLCSHKTAQVLTQIRQKQTTNGPLPVIARTRHYFSFPSEPGIMMIDIDAPKDRRDSLPADEVLQILYATCPELRESPHAIAASASSYIYHDDKELLGGRGWRVFALVANAQDIPRAGAVLFKRLWLAGHGRIEISKAGTMLERGLIDASVWQPERLDFAGGAACEPPLLQRRPTPKAYQVASSPLNTTKALPSLSPSEEAEYKNLVDEAKQILKPQADRIRREWGEKQAKQRFTTNGKSVENHPDEFKELYEVYSQASLHGILYGDFELLCQDGRIVTVGEILDAPDKWHGCRFADPLEPDYGNDPRIAWANLRAAGRPYILSHAHGGRRYTLHRARKVIHIEPGERVQIVAKTLELMRLDGGVFERGGEIVRVGNNGEIYPLKLAEVQFLLDRLARWMKFSKTTQKWIPVDVPKNMAEGVLASKGAWALPILSAVVTAPIMDLPSGRVINEEGLDEKTGLLCMPQCEAHWPTIPERPALTQVTDAVKTLWKPFAEFSFCSAVDRGVFLAAILTALVRPALETAPAFCFSAPTAGSGKTLLARCLSILAGQATPAVMAGASTEDEMRKRLLALGRSGSAVIVLDNLTGELASDALCAWLTSKIFGDRVLGVSELVMVPTRSLTLLTGNNLVLRGDLCRRVLVCKIDPGVEAPWRRGFNFDPAAYCLNHRVEMVVAALTVIKASLNTGRAPADRLASFEVWSETVRRAVMFVHENVLLDDIEDPARAIDSAYNDDPETSRLKALLGVLYGMFGDASNSVAQMISHGLHPEDKLHGIIYDIAGERGIINARKLGRWIERNAGRICGGLRLESAGKRGGVCLWRVRKVTA